MTTSRVLVILAALAASILQGCGNGEGVATVETQPAPVPKEAPRPERTDEVVYVIDRSGSMAVTGAFDLMRLELAKSIAALQEPQKFHLIFFGEKKEPLELGTRRLVHATPENKLEAGKLLEDVVPAGISLILPALERAIAALERGDPKAKKFIWLLSDGDFEGFLGGANEYKGLMGNAAVLKWLDDHNRKIEYRDEHGNIGVRRMVQIYTFLWRSQDPRAVEVMKRIAEEHDGKFTHVTADHEDD